MRPRGPGRRAFGISLLIHVVVIGPLALMARPPEPMEFESIRVTLVSPPPASVAEPEPAPAVAQPRPEPEPPEVRPEPEVEEEPEPPPEPPERNVERPETEAPPETPEATPAPSETEPEPDTAAVGGEGLNVRTEGREFPYPDYIANVLTQVNRYFRWSDESRPKGTVYFEILPDGSVRNIRMYRGSGNIRFDYAVQGAVETAGNRKAFGPLPEGYIAPSLPVIIEVEPPR